MKIAFPALLCGLAILNAQDVRLRLFAPAWRGIGDQNPATVAKQFDIIYLRTDPAPFHRSNPAVKCIIYSLGPYVTQGAIKTLPTEAVAHDASGAVVKARDWPNWLVVPNNAKLLDYERQLVRQLMAQDYDGLFIDSLGTAPIDSNYLLAKPVNPQTNKPYTGEEWLASEIKMVQAAKAALPPGKLLFMNGLGPGTRYWREPESASPRVLLAQFDGAMSESVWRTAGAPLDRWPSPENWMRDIRMIQDVDRRGLYGFWWTKCGSVVGAKPKDEETDQDLIPQWREFALASYLLAAGPKSYFNFLAGDKRLNNGARYYPEYDIDRRLGAAKAPMQELAKGAYWRQFSRGAVMVNPTAEAVVTEGRMRFHIAPHEGLILVNDK